MPRRALLLALALSAAAAQGQARDTLRVAVPVASEAGLLLYRLAPEPGVTAEGPLDGALVWTGSRPPVARFALVVPGPPGRRIGRMAVEWEDGRSDTLDVWASADPRAEAASAHAASLLRLTAAPRPASRSPLGGEWVSAPVGGLTKEVDVELYGTTRTATPGGVLVVRYAFNSYEDQDARVRLRFLLPEGWVLQDREIEAREYALEAWETIEGEARVSVPAGARPGERVVVRVIGEVVGEPGTAEVYVPIQVTRRGGLQPGQVGLTGTVSALATNVAQADLGGARYGGVVDLSGTVARNTTLTLAYRQGARESTLTNFRIAQEESRWNGTLRGRGWQAQVGNQIASPGSAVVGPSVRGQGLSARRTEGTLIGEVTVAQPTTFSGPAAGHLVRTSLGVQGRVGRVALSGSDFGRPRGYTTVPTYSGDLDPEELERLERERLAALAASRVRVQGAGLDAEFRPGSAHRLTARGGWLRLATGAGEAHSAPTAEAAYGYSHRRATLNARWREMPRALPGVMLPGDETSLDASVLVVGEWRLAGRAYRTLNDTHGGGFRSEGEGAAVGIRYARGPWRAELRGNHRAWSYGADTTTARTVSVSVGLPLGPLSLSGLADVGTQESGTERRPSRSLRTDLRWSPRAGSLAWSTSYFETLSAAPRLRADLLGSLRLAGWEMAGGAWATHGLTRGGEPGLWAQVGTPVTPDFLLTLGVERGPATWGAVPSWMGTAGIRTNLALPLPFLRAPQ